MGHETQKDLSPPKFWVLGSSWVSRLMSDGQLAYLWGVQFDEGSLFFIFLLGWKGRGGGYFDLNQLIWFQIFLLLKKPFILQKFNQVVIWDKIILRRDNGLLNYNGMNTKYYFFDDGMGLKYGELILLLKWIDLTTELFLFWL